MLQVANFDQSGGASAPVQGDAELLGHADVRVVRSMPIARLLLPGLRRRGRCRILHGLSQLRDVFELPHHVLRHVAVRRVQCAQRSNLYGHALALLDLRKLPDHVLRQ